MVVAQHDLEVLGLIPQHFRKQDVVAQACNLSTRKVQTGKPEIQGYSWLQKQVQAQPELMKKKTKQIKRIFMGETSLHLSSDQHKPDATGVCGEGSLWVTGWNMGCQEQWWVPRLCRRKHRSGCFHAKSPQSPGAF